MQCTWVTRKCEAWVHPSSPLLRVSSQGSSIFGYMLYCSWVVTGHPKGWVAFSLLCHLLFLHSSSVLVEGTVITFPCSTIWKHELMGNCYSCCYYMAEIQKSHTVTVCIRETMSPRTGRDIFSSVQMCSVTMDFKPHSKYKATEISLAPKTDN